MATSHRMAKWILLSALAALVYAAPVSAALIAGVDFSNDAGGFDATPDKLSPSDAIAVSGWTFVNGAGISTDPNSQTGRASAPVGKFNGEDGGTQPAAGGSPPTNNIHSFSVTISGPYALTLTDVSFDFSQATSGNAERWLAFKTSLDSNLLYSQVGPVRTSLLSASIPLSGAQYENLKDQTIEFQWYAGGGTTGDIDIDSILIQGTVIPEPATLLVWSLLAGLGVSLGWRRRK